MLEKTQSLLSTNRPLRLVFYGDSISEVKPGWSGGASAPERNWGALLAARLGEACPAAAVTGAHFAIGGQNTYEGLGRLDGLAAFQPDLVFVAFGANDCAWHFLLPEETELALFSLAAGIRDRFGADVVILGTGGDNPRKPFFRHLEETRRAQEQAAAQAGVPFIDIRRAILAATDNGARWADFHINEGNCHPTDPGHAVWAEAALAGVMAAVKGTGA